MIEVVSAVIVRNGRILLTQRRPEKDFAFSWECPGGKVDGNESHHDAIRRELREEIDSVVDAISPGSLWCGEFNAEVSRADRAHIFLLMYAVRLQPGEGSFPRNREGQGIGWFTIDEMRRLSLAPGNQRALEAIADHIVAVSR